MSLDPLADYLEPQFGNIYEYNLPYAGSLEVQEWTDELRQAVKHYLVHEVADDDFLAAADELAFEVPAGSREAQADAIIAGFEAWEIAHAFHLALVTAIPTLDQFVGHLDTWPDIGLQADAGHWIDGHADDQQLAGLADYAQDLTRARPRLAPLGWDLAAKLTPPQLLQTWHHVVGPAPSDLADEEWRLLVAALPPLHHPYGVRRRTEEQLSTLRRALDGIRYKFAHDLPWLQIPNRYGRGSNLYPRYLHYKEANGLFKQLLKALQHKPEASSLVAWLTALLAHADTSSTPSASDPTTVAPPPTELASPQDVRTWARVNGYEVGERGRLSRGLVRRYEQVRRSE